MVKVFWAIKFGIWKMNPTIIFWIECFMFGIFIGIFIDTFINKFGK